MLGLELSAVAWEPAGGSTPADGPAGDRRSGVEAR